MSGYVLGWSDDEVTKGNIIGTWTNFALLAVAFWIGSSSGGKAKDGDPTPVNVVNSPEAPVRVEHQEPPLQRRSVGWAKNLLTFCSIYVYCLFQLVKDATSD